VTDPKQIVRRVVEEAIGAARIELVDELFTERMARRARRFARHRHQLAAGARRVDLPSMLPCWAKINRDATRLYTANAGSDNITVFDITEAENPRPIQSLKLRTNGNPWNVAFSPDEEFLFVLNPRALPGINPGEGNALHALRVGDDGTLSEVASSPVDVPVGLNVNPIGIATAPTPAGAGN
jgi:hypothetical protein